MYQLKDWDKTDGLIHFININMFAPCQCKCIYCDLHIIEKTILDSLTNDKSFSLVINTIEYMKNHGMIADDVLWQVASGEITIHPLKDRIFDLINENSARFLTNGFIYDKRIAVNLCKNPRSEINLSIDAGTAETWYKVKGVNNFNVVIGNLNKYSTSSARPGQITLKYIILPEINDNLADYQGIIEIMKLLNVEKLKISRDLRFKYSLDEEQRKTVVKAAGNLVALLKKHGMKMDMVHYFTDEKDKINVLANEIMKSGMDMVGSAMATSS